MLQNNRFMQIGRMDFSINAKSRNQLAIVYLSQGMPYISPLLVLYIDTRKLEYVSGHEFFTIYCNCLSEG